jgi:hypothetical protein
MSEEQTAVSRTLIIAIGIICIVLVVGLVGAIANYTIIINNKNATYASYVSNHTHDDSSYNNLQNQNQQLQAWLNGNVTSSYNSGYKAGVASRGFDIVDPTYQQMTTFMATDTVHNNAYKNGTYVCWNFCNDYINEAFRAEWRCGFVYIAFPDSAHGVVCFNTTDRGIVFVEPQTNGIVKVAIGLSYWSGNGFTPATYNDTIVHFGIIW